jgi:putative adhesin
MRGWGAAEQRGGGASWWLAFVLLLASVSAAPLQGQRKVSAGYATTPDVSVRLFASVGSVHVIGWDRDSVELTGTVAAGSKVALNAPQSGAARGLKMFIEAPTEQSGREGALTMHVPRGARVWLKTGSADLTATDVTGGLDLNVVGGSITVHGNPRELRAESMDGAVTIDGAPEWMRVKTATGDIALRGGQDVGASTISGTIDARGGEADHLKLESTTGTIRFALGLARGATVEMETHSGPIEIQLSRKASVDIDAQTVTGEISNAWSGMKPTVGSEGRGMTLVTSGAPLGGRITLRSFKGKISIRPI